MRLNAHTEEMALVKSSCFMMMEVFILRRVPISVSIAFQNPEVLVPFIASVKAGLSSSWAGMTRRAGLRQPRSCIEFGFFWNSEPEARSTDTAW